MDEGRSTVLGKNCLKWCDKCNLPILDIDRCPKCRGPTREVNVNPPWDISPSFRYTNDVIRNTFNRDFGEGTGNELVDKNNVILLNRISNDNVCEIIFDGCVAAYLIYNIDGSYSVRNTLYSASLIGKKASRKVITCGKNPGKMVAIGRNLMVPGVVKVSADVQKGDEVIIIDTDGKAVGLGIANMSASEIQKSKCGMAVKCKKTVMPEHSESKRRDWRDVIKANGPRIEEMAVDGIAFMKDTIGEIGKPAVISFSGGKDSEAVVLLSIDGKLNLPLMYINSGLDFDETTELVHYFADTYNIKLIEESAQTEAFFESMKRFGPPSLGNTWCCCEQRLKPIFSVSNRLFPDGNLTFVGQRRYESVSKMDNGYRWKDKWMPVNDCASPIQDWNSLHVWLYIFMRKAPYNVWYQHGLSHTGCMMCPAYSPQTLDIMENSCEKTVRWKGALIEYQKSQGLPDEWVKYRIWKWKKVPSRFKTELEEVTGKTISELTKHKVADESYGIKIRKQGSYSPCSEGLTTETTINKKINIERLSSFAKVLDISLTNDNNKKLYIGDITVCSDGSLTAKGIDEKTIEKDLDELSQIIIRSEMCIGCSSCARRCPEGALYMKYNAVQMDASKCNGCKKCLGPCPAGNVKESDVELE